MEDTVLDLLGYNMVKLYFTPGHPNLITDNPTLISLWITTNIDNMANNTLDEFLNQTFIMYLYSFLNIKQIIQ